MAKIYYNNYSLCSVDWFEILNGMAELEYVKNHLQIKLNEAKEKFKDKDFSDQEKIVALLVKNMELINKVEEDNKFLSREIIRVNNIARDFQSEIYKLNIEKEEIKKELNKVKGSLNPILD